MSTASEFSLSFVVPCYNEESRISNLFEVFSEFSQNAKFSHEVILVNDGSEDNTALNIRQFIDSKEFSSNFSLLSFQTNRGKGFAIKKGVEIASKSYILTLDADMAAPPKNILNWIHSEINIHANRIYIGSREHRESQVRSNVIRKILGLTLNTLIRFCTGLPFKDTQCGFKLYPAPIGKKLYAKLKDEGWSHDIEILYRAKREQIPILALPIEWTHQKNSKIRLIKDGINMAIQTIKISSIVKSEEKNL